MPKMDPGVRNASLYGPSPPRPQSSLADPNIGLFYLPLVEGGHHHDGLQVTDEMNENFVGQYSFIQHLFFYMREREHTSKGEGRGRENLKQAPCSVQSLTRGLIPWPWDHDLSWNQGSDAQPTEPHWCTQSTNTNWVPGMVLDAGDIVSKIV